MCLSAAHSCLALCDPMDCSLPGSSVHGVLQASILGWLLLPSLGIFPTPEADSSFPHWQAGPSPLSHQESSGARSVHQFSLLLLLSLKSLSRVRLFATPWTVAYQAPLSMGFSRQYYWSGLPFPSPADLPNPGIEPRSPAL